MWKDPAGVTELVDSHTLEIKSRLLDLLMCQGCHAAFAVTDPSVRDDSTALVCGGCQQRVAVRGGIPRFVPSDQYASSFSVEWNTFQTTQLDSRTGRPESAQRLQQSLAVPLDWLRGKLVLDAGCGAGRFAEVALRAGAQVVGVDLSYAIDAAARNLQRWDTVDLIQADLMTLPLKPASFDLVMSLGVLHHTPNPRQAFVQLLRLVKPGGKITITVYSGYNRVYVRSTEMWRRLTTRLPLKWVYYLSHLAIPLAHVYRLPVIGLCGKAIWPISLHPDPHWRLLDTFDCYTPRYQSFHTHHEVYRWFQDAGLKDIAVLEPAISFIGTVP
jgi:SAM-dependent methyltransferase